MKQEDSLRVSLETGPIRARARPTRPHLAEGEKGVGNAAINHRVLVAHLAFEEQVVQSSVRPDPVLYSGACSLAQLQLGDLIVGR